ncbi:hypothetical protein K2X83_00890, partial [Patescibacteria group bacterium]|nr:hypothetical protein [Patescibacteria group bacterium]
FFRVKAFLALGAFILVVGLGTLFVQRAILENTDYLAAVISSAVVELTNIDRAQNELLSLKVNPVLERAAQLKANDMAAKGYFAHNSPEGLTPWHWFKAAGYNFVYAGENLAVRFYDSVDVVKAWMDSPGHRANILNSHFTEIGIGIAEGTFEGRPTVFVVQMFGSPASNFSKFPTSVTRVASAVPPATVPIATTTPVAVRGATEENLEALEDTEPPVLVKDDSFVAVRAEAATSSSLAVANISADAGMPFVQKLITSPKSVAQSVYIVLAAIIGIALILMIFIEIKRQHPKNVALGFVLLFLMIGLLALGEMLFPGTLLIV